MLGRALHQGNVWVPRWCAVPGLYLADTRPSANPGENVQSKSIQQLVSSSELGILSIKFLQQYQNLKTNTTFHVVGLRYSGYFWLYQSQIIVLYSGFELMIPSSNVFVTFTAERGVRPLGLFFYFLFIFPFLFDFYVFQSGAKSLGISPLDHSMVFSENVTKTLSITFEECASSGCPTRFYLASYLVRRLFLFSVPASPTPVTGLCVF